MAKQRQRLVEVPFNATPEQRLLVARYEAKVSELQLKWLAGRLL